MPTIHTAVGTLSIAHPDLTAEELLDIRDDLERRYDFTIPAGAVDAAISQKVAEKALARSRLDPMAGLMGRIVEGAG